MGDTEYKEYLTILDRLPVNFETLDNYEIDYLFGYSRLSWNAIKQSLKRGKPVPIPSTTVKNGELAAVLDNKKLRYIATLTHNKTDLAVKAADYAINHWDKRLIGVGRIKNVCTMYLRNLKDLRVVKRGYIATESDLTWFNQVKNMIQAEIDHVITFTAPREYAFLELRAAMFASDVRITHTNFFVANYCADCGRRLVNTLGDGCVCGDKFEFEPSDFDVCLSCQSGPFNFNLTPKMRAVFEVQGHVFRQP